MKATNVFRPIALDIFAGPGGLSEGFAQAGFEIAAQVEKDIVACQTLRLRTIYRELQKKGLLSEYWRLVRNETDEAAIRAIYKDISERCDAQVINREFVSSEAPTNIYGLMRDGLKHLKAKHANVLLGGPPCQAFSLVGRSRDANRMKEDSRHFLFQYFLWALDYFEPDFFVFENVPGILTAESNRGYTIDLIMSQFGALKRPYEISVPIRSKLSDLILDSASFEIPQRRKRIFFIGFRKDLIKKRPDLSNLFQRIIDRASDVVLTVNDAIGDLPRLKPGEGSDQWYGSYPASASLTKYQKEMRSNSEGVVNHKARKHMASDLERYKFFIEHHKNGDRRATLIDLRNERPDLMPAHKESNNDKFIDRFRVQWHTGPSSTIMSHISKDGHYYIHPDISQCRSFTVREAARCQSFTDDFIFAGPRTEQFKQVGNAVPPRLARVIATVLMDELRAIYVS